MQQRNNLGKRVSVFLTRLSVAAALFGVATFWSGCERWLAVLLGVAPFNHAGNVGDWATSIAFVIAGVAYIPLGLLLRLRRYAGGIPR